MKSRLIETTMRHITSHGFKAVTNGQRVAICVPFYRAETQVKGHQLVPVDTLKDAYRVMGY